MYFGDPELNHGDINSIEHDYGHRRANIIIIINIITIFVIISSTYIVITIIIV